MSPPPFSLTSYFNFPSRLYTSTSTSLPSLLTSSLAQLSSFQSLLLSSSSPSHSLLLTSRVRELDHVKLPASMVLEYALQEEQTLATWAGGVVVTPLTYLMSGSVRSSCAHTAVQLHLQWLSVKFLTIERLMRLRYQHILHVTPHCPTPPLSLPAERHPRDALMLLSTSPIARCLTVKCIRFVRRIDGLDAEVTRLRRQGRFLPPTSHSIVELLERKVDLQRRLRDALSDNDRYGLAVGWLLHDYHLTFALYRLEELMLQQMEIPAIAHSQCHLSLPEPSPPSASVADASLLCGRRRAELAVVG